VLCKFADVLDLRKILLGTTLITYLREVFMIGRGRKLAQSGGVSPPDNLRHTRHDLRISRSSRPCRTDMKPKAGLRRSARGAVS
jgi:hypothetical protein